VRRAGVESSAAVGVDDRWEMRHRRAAAHAVPEGHADVKENQVLAESNTAEARTDLEPDARRGMLQRSVGALRGTAESILASWPDIAIVVGLLAMFVGVHRGVEVVEFGGDAVIKWHFVRQWWHHYDWAHANLYHHHGRMGVNAVAGLAMVLFGRGWKVYYVAPFFMAALQLPFVYAIGKRIANRLAGILAAILITYLATVHRNASQLLPDPFAGTYAVIAAYFCLRFYTAPALEKRRFLAAMAVSAFCGYLAKETFFFFFPGMTVAVWLARRSVRDVVTFLGIMLGGLVIETLLYATFTKFSSRYAVVRAVHGADDIWDQVRFSQLFDRFAKLHDGWKYLFFFALAAGLWLLVLNLQRPELGRAVAIIGLSQPFFLTFFVRRFNPIEIWQSFEPRYMEPFTPFAGLLSGALLGQVVFEPWRKHEWPRWITDYGPSSARFFAIWGLALIGIFYKGEAALAGKRRNSDGWEVGANIAKVLNDTYDRNLPIATARRKEPKVLQVMYDVYLNDESLVREGKLPELEEVARNEGNFTYLVKSPSAYRRGKFTALVKAGCVIEVSRHKPSFELSSWEPLPARCDALLRE